LTGKHRRREVRSVLSGTVIGGSVELIVERGSLAGQVFRLGQAVLTIGREVGNDVVLPDKGVSRRHARLEYRSEGWLVVDLDSTNGTFVNGQRIRGSYRLAPGDQVGIGGSVLLVFRADEADDLWPEDELESAGASGGLHPLLMVMGAVAAILVLAGIVILLVVVFRPDKATPTPTAAGPLDQIMTNIPPMPTELQDFVTSIATILPTEFRFLPYLVATPTSTPAPDPTVPQRETTRQSAGIIAPLPVSRPPEPIVVEQSSP
jgi:hypothetical protein